MIIIKELEKLKKVIMVELYDAMKTEKERDVIQQLIDDYVKTDLELTVCKYIKKRFKH